jgi:predicted MFS family arabinose efflux permease
MDVTGTARRRMDPLVPAMAALVLVDVVGGLLAVASGVNTWGEAWGSRALLAAPLPMIAAQVLLTAVAVRARRRAAVVAAGLLAAACQVSVAYGVFDGGQAHDRLGPGLVVFQTLLLTVTAVVGVLALLRAVRLARRVPQTR